MKATQEFKDNMMQIPKVQQLVNSNPALQNEELLQAMFNYSMANALMIQKRKLFNGQQQPMNAVRNIGINGII